MSVGREECIEALNKAANELGRSPTWTGFRSLDMEISASQIRRKFGTWNRAKQAAGLDLYDDRDGSPLATREWLSNIKDDLECLRCGESFNEALDFHHKDDSDKFDGITHMINRYSKEKTRNEIEKCVVLCANCHRKAHSNSHEFSLEGGV